MKAKLIIDRLGPNPAYDPPLKRDFLGPNAEEEWADAVAAYDVSPEIVVPAGTILGGSLAWIHCFPDASGLAIKKDPKTGRHVPYRRAPGIVAAVPADEACEKMVARRITENARSRRMTDEQIRDELDAGIQRSKEMQSAADKEAAAA